MYRIFETEGFVRSLEQNFGGQQEKIKKKLRQYVYQQLKTAPAFGPNIKRLREWDGGTGSETTASSTRLMKQSTLSP